MAEHLSARQRRPSMARRNKRRIGAFSKRLAFSDLDGWTNAGKYVNSIKQDLEVQIGNPSPGQQILIKLVAIKMLRCEMIYERVLSQPDGGDLQDRRSRSPIPGRPGIGFPNKRRLGVCSKTAPRPKFRWTAVQPSSVATAAQYLADRV